ncbi:MAG: hypothetical protein V7L20_22590 [Nostoc sp.]
MSIGFVLSQGFGKGLSEIFKGRTLLKSAYEFLQIVSTFTLGN